MNGIRVFVQRLRNNAFVKNTLTLMTGTSLGQLITILVSPLLTRLYSPVEMGVLGLYLSIASILSIVAGGRYEFAIMVPTRTKEALSIVRLSLLITTGYTLLLVGVIGSGYLAFPMIEVWALAIPLTVFLNGCYQSLNYWNNRQKLYKAMATSRFLKAFGMSGVQASTFPFGIAGLIGGYMIGQLLAVLRLLIRHTKSITSYSKGEWHRIGDLAVQYKDYPLKSSIGGLLNTVATQFPIVLLGFYFSPATVGFFALNQRVLSLPMSFIGSAIAQVFFEKATEADRKETLRPLFVKAFWTLVSVSAFPLLIIVLFGETLFVWVFGSSWAVAGQMSQIFAPYFFVRFIFSSMSLLLMVKRAFRVEITFNLLLLFTQVGSIVWGAWFFDDMMSVIQLLSFTGILAYLYLGFQLFRLSTGHSRRDT